MRRILTRSKRLFVTRQQVAQVVADALKKDRNADLFVGGRARMARPFVTHTQPIVGMAVNQEYAKLRHIAEKMKGAGAAG